MIKVKIVIPSSKKEALGHLKFDSEMPIRPRVGEYIQASNGRPCRIRMILHPNSDKGAAPKGMQNTKKFDLLIEVE